MNLSKKSTKGLGKGLSALIPSQPSPEEIVAEISNDGIREVAITDILPNPSQPRKNFSSEALNELAQSIKEHGILQPLVVRQINNGKFEIVAGERRWRASKQAGLNKVPVVIKNLSDKEAMQIAIIENIQRQELNPVEEAEAFQKLIHEYGMTQEEMAAKVGKSRPYIANALRLLSLNNIVKNLLSEGKITAGHARALVSLAHEEQLMYAEKIIADGLSVRDIEKMVSKKARPLPLSALPQKVDADIKNLENNLRSYFGTKVKIKQIDKGGTIEIHFFSNEDLIRLTEILLPNE